MKDYTPVVDLLNTEIAIKLIKDNFEKNLSKALNLTRVSAPLFVLPETGLNDNLNGVERPVSFDVKAINKNVEIVHSLAKWKRMALKKYSFSEGHGLYTDMNAIRRDEDLDNLHSIYVDQWDWEKVINRNDRKLGYLKKTVKTIYKTFLKTADLVHKNYPVISYDLPKDIIFISTKEVEEKFPTLSRKERENAICKEHHAVFLYQIGWPLKDGESHDGRAADYDDWKLNGDILLWSDPLQMAFEISSMGIRVDENSLVKQLKKKKELSKLDNPYCQGILNGDLPLTIGGGIGQSRLCMYLLKKVHIGEVQASIWPDDMITALEKQNVHLL